MVSHAKEMKETHNRLSVLESTAEDFKKFRAAWELAKNADTEPRERQAAESEIQASEQCYLCAHEGTIAIYPPGMGYLCTV